MNQKWNQSLENRFESFSSCRSMYRWARYAEEALCVLAQPWLCRVLHLLAHWCENMCCSTICSPLHSQATWTTVIWCVLNWLTMYLVCDTASKFLALTRLLHATNFGDNICFTSRAQQEVGFTLIMHSDTSFLTFGPTSYWDWDGHIACHLTPWPHFALMQLFIDLRLVQKPVASFPIGTIGVSQTESADKANQNNAGCLWQDLWSEPSEISIITVTSSELYNNTTSMVIPKQTFNLMLLKTHKTLGSWCMAYQ